MEKTLALFSTSCAEKGHSCFANVCVFHIFERDYVALKEDRLLASADVM